MFECVKEGRRKCNAGTKRDTALIKQWEREYAAIAADIKSALALAVGCGWEAEVEMLI